MGERMAPAEDIVSVCVCVFSGTFSHFRCVSTDHTFRIRAFLLPLLLLLLLGVVLTWPLCVCVFGTFFFFLSRLPLKERGYFFLPLL